MVYCAMRCPDPNYVWPKGKVIAVPCGKCLACLSNKRKDWSARLVQEWKVSDSAYFVTLTYSDRFMPKMYIGDSGVDRIGIIVKSHLQKYFKRLRKEAPKLRYYAVGEYGSKTGRPHYHAIIFNASERAIIHKWSLYDKKKEKAVPIGIVHCGKVTEASISYVLKYVVQSRVEVLPGVPVPFALMSRGHGLGGHYLSDRMMKWHRDNGYVYMLVYGEKHRLPRFYKDKIWPSSSWSDWSYRREVVLKKSETEAQAREKKVVGYYDQNGYSPELVQKIRNAELSRVKRKVAFSQKM